MGNVPNPAYASFADSVGADLVFGQVRIRRADSRFVLRHDLDSARDDDQLRPVNLTELRALTQRSAVGTYRPIKAAPNLVSGWRYAASSEMDLGEAVDRLYPGAIADWFSVQNEDPPVTHYRDYTNRQTGMYRITTMLDDNQAARMIGTCCDARFCLKRRHWTVESLSPDLPEEKSLIPCLEPCAVLLEFARRTVRMNQEPKSNLELSKSELETIADALTSASQTPDAGEREADFNSPRNPRRIQLLKERIMNARAGLREEPEE